MNATETQATNTTGNTTQAVRDIPSMLLPVQDKQLLLPGVSVAEIVNFSYPDCPENACLVLGLHPVATNSRASAVV
ncbi:MAG: hypothetical protein R3E67_04860 [Pseudomonadales bacterium]